MWWVPYLLYALASARLAFVISITAKGTIKIKIKITILLTLLIPPGEAKLPVPYVCGEKCTYTLSH